MTMSLSMIGLSRLSTAFHAQRTKTCSRESFLGQFSPLGSEQSSFRTIWVSMPRTSSSSSIIKILAVSFDSRRPFLHRPSRSKDYGLSTMVWKKHRGSVPPVDHRRDRCLSYSRQLQRVASFCKNEQIGQVHEIAQDLALPRMLRAGVVIDANASYGFSE